METKVYNNQGKEVKKIDLSDKLFALPWNADLVHQVIVSMQSNLREPWAHVKDRSAVSGGGKKPWRQKGTGRARHGSSRSPIWIGGGVTHGPINEKDYSKKINKKMRQKAVLVLLSQKLKKENLLLVDSVSSEGPKTKEAAGLLKNLSTAVGAKDIAYKTGKRVLLLVPQVTEAIALSFRNLKSVEVKSISDTNALDLATYKYVVIASPEESVALLEKRLTTKK